MKKMNDYSELEKDLLKIIYQNMTIEERKTTSDYYGGRRLFKMINNEIMIKEKIQINLFSEEEYNSLIKKEEPKKKVKNRK
jgi:hypothetical protein